VVPVDECDLEVDEELEEDADVNFLNGSIEEEDGNDDEDEEDDEVFGVLFVFFHVLQSLQHPSIGLFTNVQPLHSQPDVSIDLNLSCVRYYLESTDWNYLK